LNPKFSIIIPLYNSSLTIKDCLDAVLNLDYSKEDYDVTVVDDASTDNSAEIASGFPFRLIKSGSNNGPAAARNIGAKQAKGDFLFFLDADVVLPKNCLKLAEDCLKEKNRKVFFASFSRQMRYQNASSQYKNLYLCYYYLKQKERTHTLDTSFAFVSRDLFEEVKGFDVMPKKFGEDIDLGMRLTKMGHHIEINKEIEAEHLKKYNFKKLMKTDYRRGKEISRLFLKNFFKKEKKEKSFFSMRPLNIYFNMPISFLISALAIATIISYKIFIFPLVLVISFFVGINCGFWFYLFKANGFFFLLKALFITFADSLAMGLGTAVSLFAVLKEKVIVKRYE